MHVFLHASISLLPHFGLLLVFRQPAFSTVWALSSTLLPHYAHSLVKLLHYCFHLVHSLGALIHVYSLGGGGFQVLGMYPSGHSGSGGCTGPTCLPVPSATPAGWHFRGALEKRLRRRRPSSLAKFQQSVQLVDY